MLGFCIFEGHRTDVEIPVQSPKNIQRLVVEVAPQPGRKSYIKIEVFYLWCEEVNIFCCYIRGEKKIYGIE